MIRPTQPISLFKTTKMDNNNLQPTQLKQRYIILDALRGLALFAIILANFPEFGLWSFLPSDSRSAMPTAGVDSIVRFIQYFLIDGKGYSVFSLLFGCGFSIILQHAFDRGSSGLKLFYRRMSLLLCIALMHLLLLWSGDILCLYAVAGMLLPAFRGFSDRQLLWAASLLLFTPVVLDFAQQVSGIDMAAPLESAWWAKANSLGITEDNFATWLRDAEDYHEVFLFLMQGAIERMWEFVEGDRLFKVLGLFVLGYYIGRNRFYTRLDDHRKHIRKIGIVSSIIGVPLSVVYALDSVTGHIYGEGVHSLLYFISVVPMSLMYVAVFCLMYLRNRNGIVFRILAKPGRMALTNYIGQSVFGILLFYGIGFGLGLSMGLYQIEIIAIMIFMLQILLSHAWLALFRYGPLEWIWRMLTYGTWLNPLK